jgi:hypothetical protein
LDTYATNDAHVVHEHLATARKAVVTKLNDVVIFGDVVVPPNAPA